MLPCEAVCRQSIHTTYYLKEIPFNILFKNIKGESVCGLIYWLSRKCRHTLDVLVDQTNMDKMSETAPPVDKQWSLQ